MSSGGSLSQRRRRLRGRGRHPFRLTDPALLQALPYHLRRLSSRLHRLRLALHARGWRGLLTRVTVGAHGADAVPAGPSSAPPVRWMPNGGPRVLIIDVSMPRPDRDSGSLRASRLMQTLVEMDYGVDFLPDDGLHAGRYGDALTAAGVAIHLVSGAHARLHWLRRHAAGYAVIVVSRYHLAEALFPLLRRIAPDARLVLDTVDLHHLREQREAEQHRDATLQRLACRTQERELRVIRASDATWVVSDVEKTLLARLVPAANVHVVSNVHDALGSVPGPQARHGVLFVGGAGHPPNLDAITWLLDALWPQMRARRPDLELHLVGEGLLQAVSAPPSGVTIHGYVPDLAPLLARVRVAVAPLRFGAGVKGKVNHAMAHGVPMVISECAAEGMGITAGKEAFIEETPAGFAEAVVHLHQDDALWARMSSASIRHIAERFSAETARAAMAASFSEPTPPAT